MSCTGPLGAAQVPDAQSDHQLDDDQQDRPSETLQHHDDRPSRPDLLGTDSADQRQPERHDDDVDPDGPDDDWQYQVRKVRNVAAQIEAAEKVCRP